MNLDNLLKEMKEKMQERDLSDKYLEENRHMTRTEMGIGEYGYGITTVPCEWVYDFLSDYKRVLKENEVLLKENEEIRIKNNAIKRESEAYAEHMSRLDNKLNLEKEKSKYEWIRQNCLPQELVNKLYIPVQKVKDKMQKDIKANEDITFRGRRNGKTLEYGKRLGRIEMCKELLNK